MQSITIIGRRWFDRKNGNTYCSAKCLVDRKVAAIVPMTYGYGNYYLQAAADALESKGLMPDREHHGSACPLWRYCDENGIAFDYSVTDGLKRDLFKGVE